MEELLEEMKTSPIRSRTYHSNYMTRRRRPASYNVSSASLRRKGGRRLVRNKVRRLQRLIPGGRGLQPDRLFLRTADYILHLRVQVNVLQALSKLYKP